VTNLTGEQKITFAVREVGAHSWSQGPSPSPWVPQSLRRTSATNWP